MLFAQLVHTSRLIAAHPGRLQKIAHLAELLRRFSDEERQVGVSYLMGRLPQGRIGVGGAVLRSLRDVPPAPLTGLEIGEVDVALSAVAQTVGTASTARRTHALRSLLGDMPQEEQDFLLRLLIGELRQGAMEGIMVDAIAKAAELPGAEVRRAVMLTGDAAVVAQHALAEGAAARLRLTIEVFRPVKPMLAQPAATMEEALARLGQAAREYKLDGARGQAL